MTKFVYALALGALVLAAPISAHAGLTSYTFDDPITLSATQAPGTWYVDRYAPAGFVAGDTTFAGRKVLKESISSADSAGNRPPAFGSSFYNTQGRKYDIPGTTKMSIELYISDSFPQEQRIAGFWGTGFDSNGDVSAYPIIEYTTENVDRFRVWDSNAPGAWVDVDIGPVATNAWHLLEIELLANGTFNYYIDGGFVHSYVAADTVEVGNVILQGYNAGTSYDVYWDNLTTVPEPATLLLLGLGAAGLGIARRRR